MLRALRKRERSTYGRVLGVAEERWRRRRPAADASVTAGGPAAPEEEHGCHRQQPDGRDAADDAADDGTYRGRGRRG